LPASLVERVSTEGIGALAPYLTDPTTENVLRLVDRFKRRGRDVMFSRQVTQLEEHPMPFTSSGVRVAFRTLSARAYDADFEGHYSFRNPTASAIRTRFQFSLPEAGTIRDLTVQVGDQIIPQPNRSGTYEWTGSLKPGEQREALIRYHALGGGTWHYDLGSQRRRVEQFRLDVATTAPVKFLREGIQPTTHDGGNLQWALSNVITAQKIALSFPPEITARDCYFQALGALPASFLIFLFGVAAIGLGLRYFPAPGAACGGLVLFGLGLSGASIVTNYSAPLIGLLTAPVIGALLACRLLGWRSLLAAVPAALIPAAFLSPRHTGLLLLGLGVVTTAVAFAGAHLRRHPV
jgi:hypothetical protein